VWRCAFVTRLISRNLRSFGAIGLPQTAQMTGCFFLKNIATSVHLSILRVYFTAGLTPARRSSVPYTPAVNVATPVGDESPISQAVRGEIGDQRLPLFAVGIWIVLAPVVVYLAVDE
jgi:hypothetical protein